jgi:hypothetical protein
MPKAPRVNWTPVIDRAAEIAESFTIRPTLRQLFYAAVSEQLLPNTPYHYKRLSALTAPMRDEGTFPELEDRTRKVHGGVEPTMGARDRIHSLLSGLAYLAERNRTDGQPFHLILGVEKDGMVAQVADAFKAFHLPVVALKGYGSQPYRKAIRELGEADPRPSVLLYAGDWDPSGEDIERDLKVHVGDAFEAMERVALTRDQVHEWHLPINMGKDTDPRAPAFIEKYGDNFQVEVDAISPDRLVGLFREAHARYHDADAYAEVLAGEGEDRADMRRWSTSLVEHFEELE